MVAALIGAAFAWDDATSGARVTLPPGFTEVKVTLPLDGAVLQAVHAGTGGGLVVRIQPFDPAELPAKVQQRVGDVEAALTADRFAGALAASQEDGSADRTVYLGFSDTVGPRVGRWVFTEPATATEPERVWWHATWRVATGWAQVVAWAPAAATNAFVPAMRDVEAGLGRTDGAAPPASLLWRTDGACEGPAAVDRMAAVAASDRYLHGRTDVSRAVATDRKGELALLGALVRDVDACVPRVGKDTKACELWEKASTTDRSAAAQAALVACLDAR